VTKLTCGECESGQGRWLAVLSPPRADRGAWWISSVIVLTDMHGGSVSVVLAALTEMYVDLFGNRADRVTPVSILLFRETFSCKSLNLHEGDVVERSEKRSSPEC
jgi:mannose/fructose-specific phosphotransferase system component IIA